ncbi:MAG: hypothetical protein RBQ88_03180 [Desulfobulbus oligotrophicus]|nr:hypothetical protein [Desulfobulbus oligotrophicus]
MRTTYFPPRLSLPASTLKRAKVYLLAGCIGLAMTHGFEMNTTHAAEPLYSGTEAPSTPPEKNKEQTGPDDHSGSTDSGQSLRQRYPEDPTGVRARLCTCRGNMHGGKKHGHGHRHRLHGGRR